MDLGNTMLLGEAETVGNLFFSLSFQSQVPNNTKRKTSQSGLTFGGQARLLQSEKQWGKTMNGCRKEWLDHLPGG
jgi:hypothetical protein